MGDIFYLNSQMEQDSRGNRVNNRGGERRSGLRDDRFGGGSRGTREGGGGFRGTARVEIVREDFAVATGSTVGVTEEVEVSAAAAGEQMLNIVAAIGPGRPNQADLASRRDVTPNVADENDLPSLVGAAQ